MTDALPPSNADDPTPPGPRLDPPADLDPEETVLVDDLRVVLTRRATGSERCHEELQGQHLGGYRIERLLGEGGMARVYEGRDIASGRQVALKILKPQYRADQGICARLEREARSMARIEHEHVVRILDFTTDGPLSAIVMEYLPGGSLRDRLNEVRAARQEMAVEEAVALVVQAASGVGAAHAVGVIHRDIKPSNLLLDAQERIKVADFGTIMVVEGTTWLTGVGQQIGTPGYMSPEQCKGERVAPASDVYSLGVSLFELLTGRLPFEAEEGSPFAIMLKHISDPPPDPSMWRSAIPAGLAGVILRCLAKNPQDRFPTAAALADALLSQPPFEPDIEIEPEPQHRGLRVNVAAVRKQLLTLPQRAIVCWACRCARRVQFLTPDPRVERALVMAEATLTEPADEPAPASVSRALSRIRTLRTASLKAAYSHEDTDAAAPMVEAARAAAAAAASAAALCIDDSAADAAFAARSAIAALRLANHPIKPWWDAARADYRKLVNARLGQEGTVGRPIPPSLFAE